MQVSGFYYFFHDFKEQKKMKKNKKMTTRKYAQERNQSLKTILTKLISLRTRNVCPKNVVDPKAAKTKIIRRKIL